jgi:hypothetical protein
MVNVSETTSCEVNHNDGSLETTSLILRISGGVQAVTIVTYLLKARTVEAEKQPLLGNARTQQ